MPNGHWPAMPQVTAVDDQFGTHRLFSQVAGQWRSFGAGVGRRRCCIAQLYNSLAAQGWDGSWTGERD
jgi:hypothetical protein